MAGDLRAPSEDIVVEGDKFIKEGHGGVAAIAVGSEMSGGVYDVFAQDDESGRTPGWASCSS